MRVALILRGEVDHLVPALLQQRARLEEHRLRARAREEELVREQDAHRLDVAQALGLLGPVFHQKHQLVEIFARCALAGLDRDPLKHCDQDSHQTFGIDV